MKAHDGNQIPKVIMAGFIIPGQLMDSSRS